MNQGDVVWVTFPAGAGCTNGRFTVILQNDEASKQIQTILVVPLTTQKDALRFPTVLIDPDHENRLPQPSVALVFQLTAIDQKFLESRQGSVTESTLDSLLSALTDITEQ